MTYKNQFIHINNLEQNDLKKSIHTRKNICQKKEFLIIFHKWYINDDSYTKIIIKNNLKKSIYTHKNISQKKGIVNYIL